MSPTRLPAAHHRGVVAAAGFLLDPALLGEDELRRRALALWQPGASLRQTARGVLVRLPAPVRIRADQAPGLVLVARRGALLAAPLSQAVERELAPRAGALLLVSAGALVTVLPEAEVDPAGWLDVAGFELEVTEALAAPAQIALAVAPPADPAKLALRARLTRSHAAVGGEAAAAALAATRRSGARAAGPSWFGRLLRRLAGALGTPAAPTPSQALASPGARPAPPGLLRRLRDRLGGLLSRLLMRTRLGEVLARRHAAYLARMLDMFQRGDLEQALRHAIPLDERPDPRSRGMALSPPVPRGQLAISPQRQRGGGDSLPLAQDLFSRLRQLYRAAFERLDAQGRHDEAAFILAELLDAAEEAVSYLERHGQLRLAAEVAEARGLPPGLIVRQWFIAGDLDRAVALARLHGAFADAVARLESARHAQAPVLRLAWADQVASAGDFAAAAALAHPIPSAQALVDAWLERARAEGGPAAARALAHQLAWFPARFVESRDAALALLDDDSPEQVATRRVFAAALTSGPTSAETTVMARATLRALLRDRASAAWALDRGLYKGLLGAMGNDILSADVPGFDRLPAPPPFAQRTEPLRLTVAAADRGTSPVHDVSITPAGLLVIALGEHGVVVLSPRGRVVARLDVPAHHLITPDQGDRFLALAPRGDAFRVSALEIGARRATELWDVPLSSFAPSYDGTAWAVGRHSELLLLDSHARRPAALWSVDRLEGVVELVSRSPLELSFLLRGRNEVWTYELGRMRLVQRLDAGRAGKSLALSAGGNLLQVLPQGAARRDDLQPDTTLWLERNDVVLHVLAKQRQGARPARIVPSWVAVGVSGGVCLYSSAGRELAQLGLGEATCTALHLREDLLLVGDDAGRVFGLELNHGAIVHDVRLTE